MRGKLPIGKALRAIREAQGLSQRDVALLTAKAGKRVHLNAISRLERGIGEPSMRTVEAVSAALKQRVTVSPNARRL